MVPALVGMWGTVYKELVTCIAKMADEAADIAGFTDCKQAAVPGEDHARDEAGDQHCAG